MKKFIQTSLAGALLLGAFLAAAPSVHAGAPSNGATVSDRGVPKDGNGNTWQESTTTLGYKVFVATAAGAVVLLDESGAAPSCGLVHKIEVSSGAAATDWAVVYDSAPTAASGLSALTVANQGVNVGQELAAVVNRLTTGPTSTTPDAQFNRGIVILQSAAPTSGTTHVFWRPCQGSAD